MSTAILIAKLYASVVLLTIAVLMFAAWMNERKEQQR